MKLIITLTTVIFCVSCFTRSEPRRVNGIPQDAFWIGGIDGGQWYIIKEINETSRSAKFKIYNDLTGELVVDRNFKLKCDVETEVAWNNLKTEIIAFDGNRIL